VTEDELQELSLAFATAIVKPGGNAAYVLPGNRLETLPEGSDRQGKAGKPQIRWDPVESVAASGRAFIVEPCEGIVPIDVDSSADRHWANVAMAALEPRGFRFVVTNSGGGEGRQHIFALAPCGWSNIQVKAFMETAAGSQPFQARLNNGIRPPFSLHRNGFGRSEIIEPGVATALRWFRDMQPRELSPRIRAMLLGEDPVTLVTNHGKPSRGLSLQRVALGAVNSRWTFDGYRAELANPRNRTAQKWRDLDPSRQTDQALEWWTKAREYARDNPAGSPNEDIRQGLGALLGNIHGFEWPGRTGATDRKVFAALLRTAIACASDEVGVSVRRLSQEAHVSKKTATAAIRRLISLGRLAPATEDRPWHANRYQIQGWAAVEESAVTEPNSPSIGGPDGLMDPSTPLLDDIFSGPPGLGPSRREAWDALTGEPRTIKQLVVRLPGSPKPATVREHCRRLRDHGFALNEGHRWWRLEPDAASLTFTATALGVRGRLAARKNHAAHEQALFRDQFHVSYGQGPAPPRSSGPVSAL
jgi:hypothetical protein